MKSRYFSILTKWLLVLCVPFLLLTASVAWALNSPWLYQYGFEQYDISQATGLEQSELTKAAKGLIRYFNSAEEYINLTAVKDGESFELFNEREIVHLKDVKGLITLDYRILLATLVYALGYAVITLFWRKQKRQLAWGMVGGSGLTLILLVALGLGTLFNFEQLFLQFHLISFSNEFWQLDPSRDYLIMLFPSGFWFDSALFCTLAAVMGAIVLGGAGGAYLLFSRKSHMQTI